MKKDSDNEETIINCNYVITPYLQFLFIYDLKIHLYQLFILSLTKTNTCTLSYFVETYKSMWSLK